MHKGRLLVATPLLGDPNFHRTVVLLLDHGDDGALGVVLNRPSELAVGEPLPAWRRFAGPPGVVFQGGPVSRTSVIALARVERPVPPGTFEPVLATVGVLDIGRDADEFAGALTSLRIFAGYAGWGPGQLEAEIEQRAWYVVGSEPGDVFSADPDDLWRSVLERQPGPLRTVSRVPPDLSVN